MGLLMNGGSLGRSTATFSTERRGECYGLGMSLFAPLQAVVQATPTPEAEREIPGETAAPEFTPEKRREIEVSGGVHVTCNQTGDG